MLRKILFFSDLHGSKGAAEAVRDLCEKHCPDTVVFLGDYLYHGPRNGVMDGYDTSAVVTILNALSTPVAAVKGNCDSEVDQTFLTFPMMSETGLIMDDKRYFYLAHGHRHSPTNLPSMKSGDVFVSGHTHVPCLYEKNQIIIMNPGSIALPRQDFPASYGEYAKGKFAIRTPDDRQELFVLETFH